MLQKLYQPRPLDRDLVTVSSKLLSHLFCSYESKIVKQIVQRIDHELHSNGSLASKLYFVGLESRMVEVMKLLDIGEGGVCFMGIHGMGGVGKTKLANVIYHVVYPQFEFRCFLRCKKDSSRGTRYNRTLNSLRKQLISDLFKGK
jgi:hypothetical protein